jgi:hypothetical protein
MLSLCSVQESLVRGSFNTFLPYLIFQAFCQITDPLCTIPNENSCLFQLEIYSLFYVVWNDHYLFPLFLSECQVLPLHHLNPSVQIQSCKAAKQFLCISFHSADWRSKYPWIVFTFSKLWMNRLKVPREWHIVYLHSHNILCIKQLIFITW